MRVSRTKIGMSLVALTGGLFLLIGPALGAGAPPCDPVRGHGDTVATGPNVFEGDGELVIRGESFSVSITTTVLGEPTPGEDGTLHVATTHTFDFGGGNTLTTMDDAVLDFLEPPALYRLNSNMKITEGTGDFANAGGRLHGHGQIDLAGGVASFDINGVICD